MAVPFPNTLISLHTILLCNTDEFEPPQYIHQSVCITDCNTERCVFNTENSCLYYRETRLYYILFFLFLFVIRMLKFVRNTEEKYVREWERRRATSLCTNYRGLALLCVAYKVFSGFLPCPHSPFSADKVGKYQCGFQRGRRTVVKVHALRTILKRRWEMCKATYLLFIDFTRRTIASTGRPSMLLPCSAWACRGGSPCGKGLLDQGC